MLDDVMGVGGGGGGVGCGVCFFFFQAEDGIRDWSVTGVQTCALPIWRIQHEYPTQASYLALEKSNLESG